jgi:lysyl-tRNA synthetase class 2
MNSNMTLNWQPSALIETLRERARIVQRIRSFFDARGFWEVETPGLSHDTVVDTFLEPIFVSRGAAGQSDESTDAGPLYLQTSPEFGMKRLLAAGAERIYQICKSFRAGETGDKHNIEFTMLEWYEADTDYQAGMNRLAEFATFMFSVKTCDRLTYREVFCQHLRFDPFQIGISELRNTTMRLGNTTKSSVERMNRDECLNVLLGCIVEPNLGTTAPLIVSDWPATQSALAIIRRDGEFEYAERFELFYRGIELANGYHELTDAKLLAKRNIDVNQRRENNGRRQLPNDSQLLHAMACGMPKATGVALGVDRLVMLLLGFNSIRDVIAFPFDRA